MKKFISKQKIKGGTSESKTIEKDLIKQISKQEITEDADKPKAIEKAQIKAPEIDVDGLEIVEVKTIKAPKKVEKEKTRLMGLLSEDEKRVISKLEVFGGYSGITKEEFQDLMGMDPEDISSILTDLEIRGIIETTSDPGNIKLCKWVRPLLKDMSKDRGLDSVETHLLNVVCVLKGEDNITQKELSRRANVPTSTLSETVIPLLEYFCMIERVGVGSSKLVRLMD